MKKKKEAATDKGENISSAVEQSVIMQYAMVEHFMRVDQNFYKCVQLLLSLDPEEWKYSAIILSELKANEARLSKLTDEGD